MVRCQLALMAVSAGYFDAGERIVVDVEARDRRVFRQ
jgi:hypothetical protein